jgi:hypothetical protein
MNRDPLSDVLPFILMMGCPILTVAIAVWIGRPLSTQARGTARVWRFRLVDVMALLILLQVCLAALVAAIAPPHWFLWYLALPLVLVPVVAMWWGGVELLGQLGVESSSRRLIFLVVGSPVALCSSFLAGFVLPCLILRAFVLDEPLWRLATPLAVLPWLSRRLVGRVVAGAAPARDSARAGV